MQQVGRFWSAARQWRVPVTGVVVASAVLAACGTSRDTATVDLVAVAATWDTPYTVTGTKTEPTYIEHVTITRTDDVFTVAGGAMVNMQPSVESVALDSTGAVSHVVCPARMDCSTARPLTGFLATASVLSAARTGRLSGRAPVRSFGGRSVVCVPAEQIGVTDPVLDPCLDLETGAVLAQLHRRSGEFDGPTFDPWSISVTAVPGPN